MIDRQEFKDTWINCILHIHRCLTTLRTFSNSLKSSRNNFWMDVHFSHFKHELKQHEHIETDWVQLIYFIIILHVKFQLGGNTKQRYIYRLYPTLPHIPAQINTPGCLKDSSGFPSQFTFLRCIICSFQSWLAFWRNTESHMRPNRVKGLPNVFEVFMVNSLTLGHTSNAHNSRDVEYTIEAALNMRLLHLCFL